MKAIKDTRLEKNMQPATTRDVHGSRAFSSTLPVTILSVLYMIMIISAEGVTIFIGALPGSILHGFLLFSLVNLHYFTKSPEARRIFLVFTLLPLLRILSLTMPIPQVPPIFWYVIVGFPLLLAVILVIRFHGLPSLSLDIGRGKWLNQLYFGLTGLPLGGIASLILRTEPIISSSRMEWIVLGSIILTLFSAVLEEIIFRGLVQKALSYPFGFLSFAFTSLLYASMFLGTLSPAYVIFYGAAGLLFSLWVQTTDSLWGVILAHSLMNIVFLLLFPLR